MSTTKMFLPAVLVLLAACAGGTPKEDAPEQTGQVADELGLVPRGTTCEQLGLGRQQLTIPGPVAGGRYALDAQNTLDVTYYDDTNTIFYFNNATLKIKGVLVSNGTRTLMWDMPEGQDAYPSLHGPTTDGAPSPPEEVTFCYDYELRVQPSPRAFNAEKPSWTITKTGPTERMVLAEGQEEAVAYEVKVSPGVTTSAGQYIGGPLFVRNLSPSTVTVDALTTRVGTLDAAITCPKALPFEMAPFTMLECAFRADVPDTSDRNVVGGGSVSHGLLVATREVVASFGSHTTSTATLDRCIKVRDEASPYNDHFLGNVCVEQGEVTFNFANVVGPFACGAFGVTTAATYVGFDTGATGSASWTVQGEVQCSPGCTLGAGYWKNHSQLRPRRYNPAWDRIGTAGENSLFFQSGGTYLEAISRPIQGNSYWTLARAYVAMELNMLNGARTSDRERAAFDAATALFQRYTPAQVDADNALRKTFVKAAVPVKDFNSGRTGPGKCTSRADLVDD